jgi:putative phage-type endonuclease
MDECLVHLIHTIVNEHPEHVVSPTYNSLVCSYVKKDPQYKSLDDSVIIDTLVALGLERSGPSYLYSEIIYEDHILYLKNIIQPAQRTPEWYKFRKEHITASNAWKAFGTPSSKNQLIYEKCLPIQDISKETSEDINIKIITLNLSENAMTWGHMFEPLTRMLYESINNTSVMDFGCIEHPQYPFLAASPDGIIVGPNNYGRMLEIKNVVSREINGIPKLDYYIQTQLQMEVCGLNECDFVETKFIEFESYNDYISYANSKTETNTTTETGIIMVYVNNGAYVYSYMPFHLKTEEEINQWLDTPSQEGEWIKNVYWKLETYSCVLIKRKREWFAYAIPILQDIWNIICTERIGDFSARAPRKRNIKININKIE